MTTIKRKQAKDDPVYAKLLEALKKNLTVPQYVIDELVKQKKDKGLAVVHRQFAIIPDLNLHISYDCESWLVKGRVRQVVSAIHIYEDIQEYIKHREGLLTLARKKSMPFDHYGKN